MHIGILTIGKCNVILQDCISNRYGNLFHDLLLSLKNNLFVASTDLSSQQFLQILNSVI